MTWITSLDQLEPMFGAPPEAAIVKVTRRLTPAYARWIEASRFCMLATVGPEGTDCTPRGDNGPVVQQMDPGTLLMPDWRGNNRVDSLRNIVRDGRVSLSFLVPGSNTVLRVNGSARLSTDPALCARFEQAGKHPHLVIVIAVGEVYAQCARALLRSGIWARDDSAGLPTVGEILTEITQGAFDGAEYDQVWPARAAQTMW
ncbi:pyridoxamine 5'-phosphate oxidase family protein [Pararhodobacter zhoushanensis]|uniref:Pyridoxamine 5'-phosphate oxidase family protein n=1 Tax=Pararhodobacter zhoushanensis TaxID=2479545 RepID=A0ABT3GWE4_9RHOB|nr:pyridoxamine 5'-phosphate oxidase family protein [Pararhodobacter zhoushanensis]MCW1931853.1 pyridoxamine 5'-phosphate oxidase family protein [Pararhodobacter zhoushanensis]